MAKRYGVTGNEKYNKIGNKNIAFVELLKDGLPEREDKSTQISRSKQSTIEPEIPIPTIDPLWRSAPIGQKPLWVSTYKA